MRLASTACGLEYVTMKRVQFTPLIGDRTNVAEAEWSQNCNCGYVYPSCAGHLKWCCSLHQGRMGHALDGGDQAFYMPHCVVIPSKES